MKSLSSFKKTLFKLSPFWLFLILFKLAAGLHYTLLAPLGAQVFPVWLVGFLIGGAAFIQLCLDVPSGYLTDKFGYKRMLVITTLFFIAASICFLFGLTQITYLASLIISILGWQFFSPGINAYVLGQADGKTVGKLISAKEVFASIGIVLSSIVIIFAVSWTPMAIGGALILVFTATLFAILAAPKDATQVIDAPKTHGRKTHPGFWKESIVAMRRLKPASYLIMITSFTASTFYAIIWFVIPLLIADQVKNGVLGLGLGIFDFSVVILGFFLGHIVDSFNKKMLILIGMITFAVAGILLGSNFGFVFLLLGFIATAGDELSELSLWAWLYSIDTDKNHYGLITGMTEVWSDLGWTVGPILAGILYSTVGPGWAIAVGGIIILANIVVYIIMLGHPLPLIWKKVPDHHEKKSRHKH
jgi:MFS family permease